MTKIQNNKAFTLTELLVSLAVLFMLLSGFGMSLGGFRRINHFYMGRQRCIAAAQAQLDSIASTGGPLDERTFEQLWPKVDVSIEKLAGSGKWKGLTLVKVTAETKTCGRTVNVTLARYMDIPLEEK